MSLTKRKIRVRPRPKRDVRTRHQIVCDQILRMLKDHDISEETMAAIRQHRPDFKEYMDHNAPNRVRLLCDMLATRFECTIRTQQVPLNNSTFQVAGTYYGEQREDLPHLRTRHMSVCTHHLFMVAFLRVYFALSRSAGGWI